MGIVIGVTCCRKRLGDGDELDHAATDTYVRAVRSIMGGVPILVPARGGEEDVGAILRVVDGLILTGSLSNLGPDLYGGVAHPPGVPEDGERDGITLPLARAAAAAGLPLLGICRGMQELNVALGGSLHQRLRDLPGRLEHSHPLDRLERLLHARAHVVRVVHGSWLHGVSGVSEIVVNSYHNQGIDRLGDGLVVEGRAPDGTVEAVRLDGHGFAVGLQWHPEYDAQVNALSRRIFEEFGEAVRARSRKAALRRRPDPASRDEDLVFPKISA